MNFLQIIIVWICLGALANLFNFLLFNFKTTNRKIKLDIFRIIANFILAPLSATVLAICFVLEMLQYFCDIISL